jgi:hypothetical protein
LISDVKQGSRRRLIGLGPISLALCLTGTRNGSAEQAKTSQAAAQYQDHPRGGLSCVGCTFFRKPQSCQVVAGDISPNGWCRLFDLPD